MFKGVDLSQWQGASFPIEKLNVDFAIIRGGYTGYGGNGDKKVKDTCFETFYKKLKAKGIPTGVYWYSCANTKEKGEAEAKFLYENCLKGKKFEYPIYIDVEEYRWHQASKTGTTNAIIGFCDYLEKKGYFVGLYCNDNYIRNYIDYSKVKKYSLWLAYWKSNTSKPNLSYDFGLWQWTNKYGVNGYEIDGNISYVDYKKVITNGGFNGYTKTQSTKPVTYNYTLVTSEPVKVGDTLEVTKVVNTNITVKQ